MATDLVLETLLAVRREVAPDLDDQLVRQCYEIQKKHQFDRDRVVPTKAMDRLIDERTNTQAGATPAKAGRA
jgi:Small protein found in certain Dnd DNA modification systems